MTNPNDYELIAMLARDSAQFIAESLDESRSTSYTPKFFISDDDTDYLPSALDMLNLALPALCSDDHQNASTELANAIRTCDASYFEPLISTPCTHFLAIDYNSPILDESPDYDNCPNDN